LEIGEADLKMVDVLLKEVQDALKDVKRPVNKIKQNDPNSPLKREKPMTNEQIALQLQQRAALSHLPLVNYSQFAVNELADNGMEHMIIRKTPGAALYTMFPPGPIRGVKLGAKPIYDDCKGDLWNEAPLRLPSDVNIDSVYNRSKLTDDDGNKLYKTVDQAMADITASDTLPITPGIEGGTKTPSRKKAGNNARGSTAPGANRNNPMVKLRKSKSFGDFTGIGDEKPTATKSRSKERSEQRKSAVNRGTIGNNNTIESRNNSSNRATAAMDVPKVRSKKSIINNSNANEFSSSANFAEVFGVNMDSLTTLPSTLLNNQKNNSLLNALPYDSPFGSNNNSLRGASPFNSSSPEVFRPREVTADWSLGYAHPAVANAGFMHTSGSGPTTRGGTIVPGITRNTFIANNGAFAGNRGSNDPTIVDLQKFSKNRAVNSNLPPSQAAENLQDYDMLHEGCNVDELRIRLQTCAHNAILGPEKVHTDSFGGFVKKADNYTEMRKKRTSWFLSDSKEDKMPNAYLKKIEEYGTGYLGARIFWNKVSLGNLTAQLEEARLYAALNHFPPGKLPAPMRVVKHMSGVGKATGFKHFVVKFMNMLALGTMIAWLLIMRLLNYEMKVYAFGYFAFSKSAQLILPILCLSVFTTHVCFNQWYDKDIILHCMRYARLTNDPHLHNINTVFLRRIYLFVSFVPGIGVWLLVLVIGIYAAFFDPEGTADFPQTLDYFGKIAICTFGVFGLPALIQFFATFHIGFYFTVFIGGVVDNFALHITRFFYNRTHFFDFLAHFKGFFDFFFIFESDYKKIVLYVQRQSELGYSTVEVSISSIFSMRTSNLIFWSKKCVFGPKNVFFCVFLSFFVQNMYASKTLKLVSCLLRRVEESAGTGIFLVAVFLLTAVACIAVIFEFKLKETNPVPEPILVPLYFIPLIAGLFALSAGAYVTSKCERLLWELNALEQVGWKSMNLRTMIANPKLGWRIYGILLTPGLVFAVFTGFSILTIVIFPQMIASFVSLHELWSLKE